MTDFDRSIISCGGKETYASKAAATTAKDKRMGRAKCRRSCHKEKRRQVSQLTPYRCDKCHAWHLGTHRLSGLGS